jgi:hypothetical protein
MGEIAKVEVTPIAGGTEPDKPMARLRTRWASTQGRS